MTYKFSASHLFSEDDGYMSMVGFSDDEFEPNHYLLIQQTHEPDSQDTEMGMDKMHIQLDDQSRSIYGGVESFTLKDNVFEVKLTDKARSALKVDGNLEIALDPNHSKFSSVLQDLKKAALKDSVNTFNF